MTKEFCFGQECQEIRLGFLYKLFFSVNDGLDALCSFACRARALCGL